jgi:SAF domain
MMNSPVILLHADDNVVVCRRAVEAGERISIEGSADVVARSNIEIGHKLARFTLPQFSKVIKYGAPIGSMTRSAEPGDWVHLHNMKSDYMSAHTRAVTGDEQ